MSSDLAINLLASIIAGVAVWTFQRAVRIRRSSRKRAFFGIRKGGRCTISVPRHVASSWSDSVHRRDLAAVLEVAAIIKDCGGEIDLNIGADGLRGVGLLAEFCIGGPHSNRRTSAHLEQFVPGVTYVPYEDDPDGLAIRIGERVFRRSKGQEEFVLLIRIILPRPQAAPLWVIYGQIAKSNQAAAQYLAHNYPSLMKTHGIDKSFCLAFRLVNSHDYDHNYLEEAGDFTNQAFRAKGSSMT